MKPFDIRGFNMCESLLRHTPEQLRTFFRRMKKLNMNTVIIHYDYGFKRFKDIILEECGAAGINIILMTFGPRTFFSYTDWKPQWFSKKADGSNFTEKLECETYPCCFEKEALEAFEYGAKAWLKDLPAQIKNIHMRAADGLDFCQCQKCRALPEEERWQPFVEIFSRAVQEIRPDLEFETDIYVRRYRIPLNRKPFADMDQIMYDTFYRNIYYPLSSRNDSESSYLLEYADNSVSKTSAVTIGDYHLRRISEWANSFPAKVYIHENAMLQGYYGVYTGADWTYLQDLKLYRQLGIRGVCYEAYEPGYCNFAGMFETLAGALNGMEIELEMPEMIAHIQREHKSYLDDPDFPAEKYISDPETLQHIKLYQRRWEDGPDIFREFMDFALERREKMDWIHIGYSQAKFGLCLNKLKYRRLSPEVEEFVSSRKLWDFMEKIPLNENPHQVCLDIFEELLQKVY